MKLIGAPEKVAKRSGAELTADDLVPVRRMLESSKAIYDYEQQRKPRTGKVTYSFVDLLMILLYVELRQTTFRGAISEFRDKGGQEKLKVLGMPCISGVYRCPSAGRMSMFVCRDWPELNETLIREITDVFTESLGSDSMFWTCDSTPLEASRYSDADYNIHYEIRMDKMHILAVNGFPVCFTHTDGNTGDAPQMKVLIESAGRFSPALGKGYAADGAYHSFELYAEVYCATGLVLAVNQGIDAVFHEEATWEKVLKRYTKYWRKADYAVPSRVKPADILRFLCRHGESDFVGRFLHNLDFMRGKAIKSEYQKSRHICETLHFEAKRWIRLDIRGLHKKHKSARISLRFYLIQVLSLLFEPITGR